MKFKKLAALVLAGVLCISALTGCGGMDVNETAATLGEQTVSLGIANFMCKYQKAEMVCRMSKAGKLLIYSR